MDTVCLDIFGAKISSKHLVLQVAFAESPKCVDRTLCYTKFGSDHLAKSSACCCFHKFKAESFTS